MRKLLILSITLTLAVVSTVAQTYHEDDKEGLRIFLRQPSAEEGKINAEQLGLSLSDTINWYSVEIFDVVGKTRHVETWRAASLRKDSAIEVNISHLPAGIYFVRAGGETTKLIKN